MFKLINTVQPSTSKLLASLAANQHLMNVRNSILSRNNNNLIQPQTTYYPDRHPFNPGYRNITVSPYLTCGRRFPPCGRQFLPCGRQFLPCGRLRASVSTLWACFRETAGIESIKSIKSDVFHHLNTLVMRLNTQKCI